MLQDYIRLSISNLLKRKLRSWLTVIGVIIGILAVVSLIGLGEGLRSFVTGQFNLLGTDVLTIQAQGTGNGPPGTGVTNPLTESQLNKIRNVKGVETAFGRVIENGRIEFNDQAYFGFVASIPDGRYRRDLIDAIDYEVETGRMIKDEDKFRITVGNDYTDKERFGKAVQIGTRIKMGNNDYTVVGILEKRGSFIVDNTILMNEDFLRDEFNVDRDEYDAILAKVPKGVTPSEVKPDIEKVLRRERDVKVGEEDFTVQTPDAALRNLDNTLIAVQIFVIVIASISLVVGGIGILNTMYTAVLERVNDIGVMKAIGAKNSTIFTLFFIESGLIGFVGGAIGVILGSALSFGLAAAARSVLGIDTIQASLSPALIIGALGFSFIIGSIAGITPALRAAKLNPIDALNSKK